MPSYQIPGFKASKGIREFEKLVDGEYVLECTNVEVREPKNPSPTDVWWFFFDVISGPPQADGKPAKGKQFLEFVNILHEDHPSYKPEWSDPDSGKTQMGVDQLKAMAIAMGVKGKGDTINPDSFKGCQCKVHITIEVGKNDGKERNRARSWAAI